MVIGLSNQTVMVDLEGVAVETVALSPVDAALVDEYSRLTTLETEIKKQKAEIKDVLLDTLGAAKFGSCDGRIAIKVTDATTRSIDYDALRESHPEAYASLVKETEGTRVYIK